MSDLQCAATLLIARHGDADQVRALAHALRSRRIAAVYTSRMQQAVESGELAAAGLGTRSSAVDGLQELSAGEEREVAVSRFRDALEAIADVHRGEVVLVFTHGAVIASVVPQLCSNMRNNVALQQLLPSGATAEIDVDADGWRLVSWPGVPEPATATASEQA